MEKSNSKQEWLDKTRKPFIEKRAEQKDKFTTLSNINVEPLYSKSDLKKDEKENIGYPGEYPFTRGVYPSMYRGRYWTMRQYAGFGDAKQSNERYKYLLSQGQTGLSVAFDLPTQIGYDSSDQICDGEVGKVGVAIDSLKDMEILFDGIPLDKVSTSMTINSPAAVLLAMYIAVAEKQNVTKDKLTGTIQNDILKEYIARGTYIFPPKPSMRLITDIFEYCSKNVPRWNTISISGYHIREAGSNAIQEIGFTLADGIAYVEAAINVGLDVDKFAKRLSFFFNAHNNLFEEVAKFRAARRLWAKIMKERFGAKDKKSLMLRFHTQTGGSTLTAQQPDNNIARVTIQALSAVLGGTQSLHTNSRDEALSLPTEDSVRVALRTQQIIANESGVADTVDPLGGSYFVESLTDKLEKYAMEYIEKIDEMGGMIEAIEKGYVQREIQKEAYRFQKEMENEDRIIVGMNKYQIKEEPPKNLLKIDPAIQKNQIEKLKDLKEKRDNKLVKRSLQELKEAAKGNENLMPYIINSVKAYSTIGEISNILKEIFGEYNENVVV
ncbi:MAG: methylmalonyl-CoA mutase family protein [Candidatus Marinimicrobia bacterium]|nr:methylmalonyl-CoA mutase family protein [Candidatus Neomarinimicrobiota bacterium]